MRNSINKKKLLEDYDKKAEDILKRMFQVLLRAQRKTEDKTYRETLSKLK